MGWAEYALALAAFVGSHFVPRIGGLRERLIARVGRRTYFSVYGLVSVAVLIWVIVAAGRAPFVELWPQLPWMRWVPNVAMPLAAVLVAAGFGIAQPHTLGGKRGAVFDPERPGVAALSRHPLFLALALWASAHLVANGDLAHVILFAIFAALALGAIPVFDARARRALGPDAACAFFEASAVLSLAPLTQPAWRRENGGRLIKRAAIGLAVWAVLLGSHGAVIGVSPLP
tara:strand:+ start:28483 stop:29172 length:690 start_codon:yes stop_codon:yes gene_type:complete